MTTMIDVPPIAAALAPYEAIQDVARNQILFREGEQPLGVYYLHSGEVDLVFAARNGDAKTLRVAEPGQMLALSSVVARRAHDCTATAKSPVSVGFVRRDDFQRILDEQPGVWLAVLQLISEDVNACWDCMRALTGIPR